MLLEIYITPISCYTKIKSEILHIMRDGVSNFCFVVFKSIAVTNLQRSQKKITPSLKDFRLLLNIGKLFQELDV